MINKFELSRVRAQLLNGEPLNLSMLGDIFGQEFWKLLVLSHLNIDVINNNLVINVYPNGDPKIGDPK